MAQTRLLAQEGWEVWREYLVIKSCKTRCDSYKAEAVHHMAGAVLSRCGGR